MLDNQPTKLNPVQLHLIKMFSAQKNADDLVEIKSLLSNYYAQKVDEESDKIWQDKALTQNSVDELLNSHLRTPYK